MAAADDDDADDDDDTHGQLFEISVISMFFEISIIRLYDRATRYFHLF